MNNRKLMNCIGQFELLSIENGNEGKATAVFHLEETRTVSTKDIWDYLVSGSDYDKLASKLDSNKCFNGVCAYMDLFIRQNKIGNIKVALKECDPDDFGWEIVNKTEANSNADTLAKKALLYLKKNRVYKIFAIHPDDKYLRAQTKRDYWKAMNKSVVEGRMRTNNFGCFSDLNEAEECVHGNYSDLNEGGYYPYIVIMPEKINTLYPRLGFKEENILIYKFKSWEEGYVDYVKDDEISEAIKKYFCPFIHAKDLK